jgi:hypothetical protein
MANPPTIAPPSAAIVYFSVERIFLPLAGVSGKSGFIPTPQLHRARTPFSRK